MNFSQCVARAAICIGSGALLLTLSACGGGSTAEPAAPVTPAGTEQPAQTFKASDYIGGNAGDQLVYSRAGDDVSIWGGRIEHLKSKQTDSNSTRIEIEDSNVDGADAHQRYITIDSQGIWLSDDTPSTGLRAGTELSLPASFKTGDTFVHADGEFRSSLTDDTGTPYESIQHYHTDSTIVGLEDVTTHAGVFKDCVKVLSVTTGSNTTIKNGMSTTTSSPDLGSVTTWYAPGIGKVRETQDDGFYTDTRELYAYHVAGKSNELVRPTATVASTGLPTVGPFVIRFSEPMQLATLNSDTLQVLDPNGQAMPFTTSTGRLASATSLFITPSASYVPVSGTYQFKISDKVTDLAGNGLIPYDQSIDITISRTCCDFTGTTIWLWAH